MLIKRIFKSNIMLYNIKTLTLHCVFHGIRFKVNEDWVSVIDTLLFLCKLRVAGCGLRFSAITHLRKKGYAVAAYPSFFVSIIKFVKKEIPLKTESLVYFIKA